MSTKTFDAAATARGVMRDGDTDFEAFFGHFAPDCRFQWGNVPAVTGLEAIQRLVDETLVGVQALSHVIREVWSDDNSAVLSMEVSYAMEDGAHIAMPAVTIMRFRDGKICEYLIFQDPAPLRAEQRRQSPSR